MNTPLSTVSMFSNIITNPIPVFNSIKLKTSFMAPLILLSVLTATLLFMYYKQIDPVWFVDYIIASSGEDMAPDQIEQMRKIMKPENMMVFGAVGAVIMIIVVMLVQSLYLLIVGNTQNIDVSFGEWFSLTAWTSVPAILLGIMMIFNLTIGDNSQLAPELLNPISFASLFGMEGPGSLYKVMTSISLITFWGMYLLAVGYRHWSGASWTASTLIIAIPYILIWLGQAFLF